MTDDEVESLTAAWRTRWRGSPIAHELRERHADRWVRFHSLPWSKRYAETEDEYEIILDAITGCLPSSDRRKVSI